MNNRARPAYFASHPKPTSPRDVLDHQCIRFRHRGESVYKWEFHKGDESLAIAVTGALLLDKLDLLIQAALDGAGLAWVAEDRITDHLASGALVRVLEDWCPPFPGFFLYYPIVGSNQPLSRPLSTRSDSRVSGLTDRQTSSAPLLTELIHARCELREPEFMPGVRGRRPSARRPPS